jgi:SpoVK/Ycf46/Vps4 family AAA+-type ATPase
MRKRELSFDGYTQDNDKYFVSHRTLNKQPRIEAGVYRMDYHHETKRVYLYETELKHDDIIDLPSEEYKEVLRTMGRFLMPEVKAGYAQMGYLYKRNLLMYGEPGTGKTILVNRISKAAVELNNAVCIFVDRVTINGVDGVQLLEVVLNWLLDTNPDSLLVLIMEEVDEMIIRNEHKLLVFLDGQMQRPNTIVLGTTNHIDNIPARFLRPGRFSQTVEVALPSALARRFYLKHKLGKDFKDLDMWAKNTKSFTIDDLKEVIQSCYLLGEPFKRVVERLRKTKKLPEEACKEESWEDEPALIETEGQ